MCDVHSRRTHIGLLYRRYTQRGLSVFAARDYFVHLREPTYPQEPTFEPARPLIA